jgi:hypothetical protein
LPAFKGYGNKVWTVLRILVGSRWWALVNQLVTNIDVDKFVEKRTNSLYFSYGFYLITSKIYRKLSELYTPGCVIYYGFDF